MWPSSIGTSEDDELVHRGHRDSEGAVLVAQGQAHREEPEAQAGARGGKGRQVVGLKIGASQIAAAVVVETDAGHELVELARRPLAAGIVVDGEIRDMDALSNALKAFFEEEKLPKKDVRIGLASNRIGVRTFDIVGIDDEAQFDNAVRFKAHEVLPVAVHESVLDYRVLEERPERGRRAVPARAARRRSARPGRAVCRGRPQGGDQARGHRPRGARAPAGVRRSEAVRGARGRRYGHRRRLDRARVLDAARLRRRICEFTRVFDWGGSALEDAIATSLEVHPAEAATILRHLSLSGPGRQFDALDEAARARALDAVRLRLTPFARELVSSLQFYQTQNESLGIGGIVITGGTSHLEGLADALHQMIGVNVSVGDPLARVVTAGDFDPAIEASIGSMAVPIGLAIDDIAMRGVNLLPKDAVKSRSTRSTMIAIGAPLAVAVPLVALGVLYMGAHGKAADTAGRARRGARQRSQRCRSRQGPRSTPASSVKRPCAPPRSRAFSVAASPGTPSSATWRGSCPANVWLKSLSAKQPESAGTWRTAPRPLSAPTPGQAPPPHRRHDRRVTPTPSRMSPACSRDSRRFRRSERVTLTSSGTGDGRREGRRPLRHRRRPEPDRRCVMSDLLRSPKGKIGAIVAGGLLVVAGCLVPARLAAAGEGDRARRRRSAPRGPSCRSVAWRSRSRPPA